jgi:hypothetical protein
MKSGFKHFLPALIVFSLANAPINETFAQPPSGYNGAHYFTQLKRYVNDKGYVSFKNRMVSENPNLAFDVNLYENFLLGNNKQFDEEPDGLFYSVVTKAINEAKEKKLPIDSDQLLYSVYISAATQSFLKYAGENGVVFSNDADGNITASSGINKDALADPSISSKSLYNQLKGGNQTVNSSASVQNTSVYEKIANDLSLLSDCLLAYQKKIRGRNNIDPPSLVKSLISYCANDPNYYGKFEFERETNSNADLSNDVVMEFMRTYDILNFISAQRIKYIPSGTASTDIYYPGTVTNSGIGALRKFTTGTGGAVSTGFQRLSEKLGNVPSSLDSIVSGIGKNTTPSVAPSTKETNKTDVIKQKKEKPVKEKPKKEKKPKEDNKKKGKEVPFG